MRNPAELPQENSQNITKCKISWRYVEPVARLGKLDKRNFDCINYSEKKISKSSKSSFGKFLLMDSVHYILKKVHHAEVAIFTLAPVLGLDIGHCFSQLNMPLKPQTLRLKENDIKFSMTVM